MTELTSGQWAALAQLLAQNDPPPTRRMTNTLWRLDLVTYHAEKPILTLAAYQLLGIAPTAPTETRDPRTAMLAAPHTGTFHGQPYSWTPIPDGNGQPRIPDTHDERTRHD